MKLFAQHGAMDGDKAFQGAVDDYVDGVIFSPRDLSLQSLREKLDNLGESKPSAERLVDPQFYTCLLANDEKARLGYLPEDYSAYFRTRRRAQLERESAVTEDILASLSFQSTLAVTSVIAPNILIPRSFNSIESVIAKNFIRQSAVTWRQLQNPKALYASLVISSQAFRERRELFEFLNEITMLENRPAGIYLLVAMPAADARYELFDPNVVSGWMLVNHVLSLNGFQVINGYSDLLTPFLGAAGGSAGATGWWSNLRAFSLERFEPSVSKARRPKPRYLSVGMLNRITHYELDALRARIPGVLNQLATDSSYPIGALPNQAVEVMQSWDALRALIRNLVRADTSASIEACAAALKKAIRIYDNVPIVLDEKSSSDHLEPLQIALSQFASLAEIDFST